jgi:ApaG protein
MSIALTQGIRVEVESAYVAERSAPDDAYFFFAYHVRISNQGAEPAQLLSRRWIITDAEGRQELVEGPGVVGEQPILEPGEEFEYTSYCPLPTAVGAMQGAYRMVTKSGQQFEAEIAPFTLAMPFAVN